jgi:hypothetical protein
VSHDENDPGHGNSPAAWVAVVIMLVGFSVGTIAFFLEQPVIVWVSVGIVVLGLLAGFALSKLGYGVKGPRYAPKSNS